MDSTFKAQHCKITFKIMPLTRPSLKSQISSDVEILVKNENLAMFH